MTGWRLCQKAPPLADGGILRSAFGAYHAGVVLPIADDRNAAEAAYWNGAGGARWVAHQRSQDALLAPVLQLLIERSGVGAGEVVLDIGCGAGTTSIALAKRVAPAGRVLAVDISAPLLERARQQQPAGLELEFALGDATVYPFPPGQADLLFSRFGVMFFADPTRSFTNMRTGLAAGARLVFACWREPRENPWLMLPLEAAYRHVPRLPATPPEAPGPFAFASAERVRRILEGAGFSRVRLEPCELSLDLAEGDGLDRAVEMSLGIGPTSRALDGQPPALRVAVAESMRAALAPYQQGERVPLPGAIWVVTALSP
ncbi:MAG: methyltransferase domain-containing protein [Gammaproteobacteria bacterium]|nr:methyltransferase domain-containing protein [Gammaproteobacteria bacterium]MBV9316255.1 methyltransferase domain-containing protein [Gammaproteobacteria bacterium]MBV9724080.1 methyltransferase domain-containing protein [Gammaproteobacteria bacterium]